MVITQDYSLALIVWWLKLEDDVYEDVYDNLCTDKKLFDFYWLFYWVILVGLKPKMYLFFDSSEYKKTKGVHKNVVETRRFFLE